MVTIKTLSESMFLACLRSMREKKKTSWPICHQLTMIYQKNGKDLKEIYINYILDISGYFLFKNSANQQRDVEGSYISGKASWYKGEKNTIKQWHNSGF